MELFLNKIHYGFYCLVVSLHHLFNKINPFYYLLALPCTKNRWKKQGHKRTPKEGMDDLFLNKKYGLDLLGAGGVLFGLLSIIVASIVKISIGLVSIEIEFNSYYYWFSLLIGYPLAYFYVFKNDMYLTYFKKFEKWTSKKKTSNNIISILFILVTIALFFMSLLYFD